MSGRTLSLVQRVQIASPCSAEWNSMQGDERVRFCSQCKLNVYNLSAMTEEEGERLIIQKEGKLCARVFRRWDGTILTRDCPVGIRGIRRHVVGFGLRTVGVLAVLIGAAAHAIIGTRERYTSVAIHPQLQPTIYSQAKTSMRRWFGNSPYVILTFPRQGWIGGDVWPMKPASAMPPQVDQATDPSTRSEQPCR